jgi:hypothetical protein
MSNFNPIYQKFIDDKNAIQPEQMRNGKFYLLKQYQYANGEKGRYADTIAPIIFTIYISKAKDLVHAVKVSNINPQTIKGLFGKLINEKTETIQMKGGARKVYESVIGKIPKITRESYRTYNLSGIKKVILLDMDVTNLVPKNKLRKDK